VGCVLTKIRPETPSDGHLTNIPQTIRQKVSNATYAYANVSPYQKQLICLFFTTFSPTPQGGHHGNPVLSPLRSIRHADHASGRRSSGATAGGFDPSPTLSLRAPTSFAPEESPASPSSAWRSAPATAAPPFPHRAAVGFAAAGTRRRRRAASAAPVRTRAMPQCGRRLGVRPIRGPRPIGVRRRCQVGRGGANAAEAAAVGAATGGLPHARTRVASTGRTRRRGRRRPAAKGSVGSSPAPSRRHAVRRGGRSQRQRRRRRPDGAQSRAAVAAPAGRPPPRQWRATADATAEG